MLKMSKHSRKVTKAAALIAFAAISLTACSATPGGRTLNVVTGDYTTNYLRVNDTNTVCFTESTGSSSMDGTFCDFSDIVIPNGVEVIVLSNSEPHNEDWKLNHFVDLKNKTSDCLSLRDTIVSCNFLGDEANGSFGTEK